MSWFKMLPGASLRASMQIGKSANRQIGKWFTKGISPKPETMQPCHEETLEAKKKGKNGSLQNKYFPLFH